MIEEKVLDLQENQYHNWSDVHKPEQVYNKIPKIIKKLKKVISDEEFIEFTEINPQKVLNNEDIIK